MQTRAAVFVCVYTLLQYSLSSGTVAPLTHHESALTNVYELVYKMIGPTEFLDREPLYYI